MIPDELDTDLAAYMDARAAYAERIREYVRAQVDQWRKLPRLALLAEGRHEWRHGEEYRSGHWCVFPCRNDTSLRPSITVDLENGELCNHGARLSDEDVIKAMECFPDRLDAGRAAARFQGLIDKPIGRHYATKQYERDRCELHERFRHILNEPLYTRRR